MKITDFDENLVFFKKVDEKRCSPEERARTSGGASVLTKLANAATEALDALNQQSLSREKAMMAAFMGAGRKTLGGGPKMFPMAAMKDGSKGSSMPSKNSSEEKVATAARRGVGWGAVER